MSISTLLHIDIYVLYVKYNYTYLFWGEDEAGVRTTVKVRDSVRTRVREIEGERENEGERMNRVRVRARERTRVIWEWGREWRWGWWGIIGRDREWGREGRRRTIETRARILNQHVRAQITPAHAPLTHACKHNSTYLYTRRMYNPYTHHTHAQSTHIRTHKCIHNNWTHKDTKFTRTYKRTHTHK